MTAHTLLDFEKKYIEYDASTPIFDQLRPYKCVAQIKDLNAFEKFYVVFFIPIKVGNFYIQIHKGRLKNTALQTDEDMQCSIRYFDPQTLIYDAENFPVHEKQLDVVIKKMNELGLQGKKLTIDFFEQLYM